MCPMSPNTVFQVVLVTFPSEEKAAEITRVLVEESLIACGNLVPRIRSLYRWEGRLQDEVETLALLKSEQRLFESLKARILSLHPYACPEILALPVTMGHEAYLKWLGSSLR